MSAKEMFEKLGYKYRNEEEKILIYNTNICKQEIYKIIFYKTDDNKFKLKFYESYHNPLVSQAINQQCKELGWIEWN